MATFESTPHTDKTCFRRLGQSVGGNIMACFNGPAQGAVLNEFARLEGTNVLTTMDSVLNFTLKKGSVFDLRAARRCYNTILAQIHPNGGGIIDPTRATMALSIATRAFEQCKNASRYNSWKRNQCGIAEVTEDWDFVIPVDLMYSEVLSRDEVELSSATRKRSLEAAAALPLEDVGAAGHDRFTDETQRDVVDGVSTGTATHIDPQLVRS